MDRITNGAYFEWVALVRVLCRADFLVGTLLEGDACGRAGRLKCGQSILGCVLNVVKMMGSGLCGDGCCGVRES